MRYYLFCSLQTLWTFVYIFHRQNKNKRIFSQYSSFWGETSRVSSVYCSSICSQKVKNLHCRVYLLASACDSIHFHSSVYCCCDSASFEGRLIIILSVFGIFYCSLLPNYAQCILSSCYLPGIFIWFYSLWTVGSFLFVVHFAWENKLWVFTTSSSHLVPLLLFLWLHAFWKFYLHCFPHHRYFIMTDCSVDIQI